MVPFYIYWKITTFTWLLKVWSLILSVKYVDVCCPQAMPFRFLFFFRLLSKLTSKPSALRCLFPFLLSSAFSSLFESQLLLLVDSFYTKFHLYLHYPNNDNKANMPRNNFTGHKLFIGLHYEDIKEYMKNSPKILRFKIKRTNKKRVTNKYVKCLYNVGLFDLECTST